MSSFDMESALLTPSALFLILNVLLVKQKLQSGLHWYLINYIISINTKYINCKINIIGLIDILKHIVLLFLKS